MTSPVEKNASRGMWHLGTYPLIVVRTPSGAGPSPPGAECAAGQWRAKLVSLRCEVHLGA